MKKILIITFNAFIPPAAVQVVTGLLTGYIAKGQGIYNELTVDEWKNIKINGVTLERLGLTNGDANEIKLLFGGTPETSDQRHEPIPTIYHAWIQKTRICQIKYLKTHHSKHGGRL